MHRWLNSCSVLQFPNNLRVFRIHISSLVATRSLPTWENKCAAQHGAGELWPVMLWSGIKTELLWKHIVDVANSSKALEGGTVLMFLWRSWTYKILQSNQKRSFSNRARCCIVSILWRRERSTSHPWTEVLGQWTWGHTRYNVRHCQHIICHKLLFSQSCALQSVNSPFHRWCAFFFSLSLSPCERTRIFCIWLQHRLLGNRSMTTSAENRRCT